MPTRESKSALALAPHDQPADDLAAFPAPDPELPYGAGWHWARSEFPQPSLERLLARRLPVGCEPRLDTGDRDCTGLGGRPRCDPQPRRRGEGGFGYSRAPESSQRQCRRLKQRGRGDLNRMGDPFRIAERDLAARLGHDTSVGESKAKNERPWHPLCRYWRTTSPDPQPGRHTRARWANGGQFSGVPQSVTVGLWSNNGWRARFLLEQEARAFRQTTKPVSAWRRARGLSWSVGARKCMKTW